MRGKSKILSAKQIHAIQILSEVPQSYKTLNEVAERVNVNIDTLLKWRKKELFLRKLALEADKNFKAMAGVVRTAHLKGIVAKQDPTLIKLYYQNAENWVQKLETQMSGTIAISEIDKVFTEITKEKKSEGLPRDDSDSKQLVAVNPLNAGISKNHDDQEETGESQVEA